MEKVLLIGWSVCLVTVALLGGCNMMPSRPDALFGLYRDRMKSEKIDDARGFLTPESASLAKEIQTRYKLKQAPEDLALLNALDPVSAPTVVESSDTLTTLQARTLKGGLRIVRVIRTDEKAPWKVDLVKDLKSLQSFLEARRALEMIREQAGEYAATWKAFNDRLDNMVVTEPAPPKPAESTKQHKPQKPSPKKPVKKKGHPKDTEP